MKDYKDKIGKVASFAIWDTGDYNVLVEEVNGSKIKGLIVYSESAYPSATIPKSAIPLIEREEFDLDDEMIYEGRVKFREPTSEEFFYERYANKEQEEFKKEMVDLSGVEGHAYQSLIFEICDVEDGYYKGVHCLMNQQNILGVDNDGPYLNPYVVDRDYNTNTLEYMEEAYDTYCSAKGAVLPDTMISYNITRETADFKTKKICSVSVPYSVVKEKGMDIIPVELSEDIKAVVKDSIEFMRRHEYQNEMND